MADWSESCLRGHRHARLQCCILLALFVPFSLYLVTGSCLQQVLLTWPQLRHDGVVFWFQAPEPQ